jgi:hypothetical protein
MAVASGSSRTSSLEAQDLAAYDYEHLTFRGIGLEGGYIFPSRVEPTWTAGARADLGYLGPGVRLLSGFNYWSSPLKDSEVSRLERRLEDLVNDQLPAGSEPAEIDLGEVTWTDYVLSLDGQVVWQVPFGVLTYTGLGLSAHIMDGKGQAIRGTFVEDLLDTVRAGINAHAGLEVPLHPRARVYGAGRFELLGDLHYFELRGGAQIFLGSQVPADHPGADSRD